MNLTKDDMMIVRGEDNGGYDWKVQFCSLEGYECQFKKEKAGALINDILENQLNAKLVKSLRKDRDVAVEEWQKLQEDRDILLKRVRELENHLLGKNT